MKRSRKPVRFRQEFPSIPVTLASRLRRPAFRMEGRGTIRVTMRRLGSALLEAAKEADLAGVIDVVKGDAIEHRQAFRPAGRF
jgi:hypothetical protein